MRLQEISKTVEALISNKDANGKSAVKNFGFLSCSDAIHIKHVPFYESCFILVLSGRKLIFSGADTIYCDAGDVVTVPGPSSFDLRNEPDQRTKKYKALVIPFSADMLERLGQVYFSHAERQQQPAALLKFNSDHLLHSSIEHYLRTSNDPILLEHRLAELLLILLRKNDALLRYTYNRDKWSQRVRTVIAADLTKAWKIIEVSAQLITTESTLRRNLKIEGTGFRELLFETRLSSALMRLLQTTLPVYQIAYDCGYQSVSRFSSNFRRRFGVAPTEFRSFKLETEQILTV